MAYLATSSDLSNSTSPGKREEGDALFPSGTWKRRNAVKSTSRCVLHRPCGGGVGGGGEKGKEEREKGGKRKRGRKERGREKEGEEEKEGRERGKERGQRHVQ